MSAAHTAALIVRPCIVRSTADTTGVRNLLFRNSLAGAPSSTALTLPAAAKGVYVDLLAVGCNVQYGIVLDGDTAPTLVYNQAVTMGTGHEAAAKTLVDGVEKSVFIPPNAKQLVFMWAAATTGANFEGCISSQHAAV